MKVFFVSRGYPTSEYKLNGIFEMDQAKALVKQGVDVVFLALDLRSIRRKRKFGYRKFIEDGVKVYAYDFPIGNINKNLFFAMADYFLLKLYKKVEKEEGKPDLLHAYFTDQAYMTARLSDKTGIPFFITEGNSHVNKDQISLDLRRRASYAYEKANRLITVSSALKSKIIKEFSINSEVIPNLANLSLFSYENRKEDPIFRIVSTARVTKLKGFFELVDAFKMAFNDKENVSLEIFGDGPDKKELEKKILEYNLENRIFLRGMKSRADIASAYKKSDLFVLYSHTETFGLAYLEALAAGLVVISSKCGGPESLINKENGYLVDLNNTIALSETMKEAYHNFSSFDREKISLETRKLYSEEVITKKIIDIYKEVLGEDM